MRLGVSDSSTSKQSDKEWAGSVETISTRWLLLPSACCLAISKAMEDDIVVFPTPPFPPTKTVDDGLSINFCKENSVEDVLDKAHGRPGGGTAAVLMTALLLQLLGGAVLNDVGDQHLPVMAGYWGAINGATLAIRQPQSSTAVSKATLLMVESASGFAWLEGTDPNTDPLIL
jgi:hypothetical protein